MPAALDRLNRWWHYAKRRYAPFARYLRSRLPLLAGWTLVTWSAFGWNARAWAASFGSLMLLGVVLDAAAAYYEAKQQAKRRTHD